jgi:hypothetical protein
MSTTLPEVTMDTAAKLLRHLTDAGDRPFLWGAPGIGKSDVVHQLGAETSRKVLEFHAALRETVDLRGIPVADPVTGTTRWLIPDELPQAARDGEEGYLFVDEFNQAPPQVQAVFSGLILTGKIGDYQLPPGWRVIAAGNRVSDRAAAQRMPTHLRNRFAHIYCVAAVEPWAKWANANNVAPEAVAFVRFRPELIHQMPQGDENAFPTPRSLTAAAKHVDAPDNLRLRLFASHIGDGAAAEFDGFVRLYRSIGTLQDIIARPDRIKVPTEPSEKFAVCTGLARLATRANWPAIMKYAARLDGDPQVLLVHDAVHREPSLRDTKEYSQWAVTNSHVLM